MQIIRSWHTYLYITQSFLILIRVEEFQFSSNSCFAFFRLSWLSCFLSLQSESWFVRPFGQPQTFAQKWGSLQVLRIFTFASHWLCCWRFFSRVGWICESMAFGAFQLSWQAWSWSFQWQYWHLTFDHQSIAHWLWRAFTQA